jgi:type I restriction enzyme S subunit
MAITSPEKNWVKTKLGNVAEDIRILVEPTETEKYPYIGLQHIEQQSLRLNEIGASTDTISTKKVFQKGDILFGSLRPYFRKVVRPGFDGVCSTDITVIRAKEDTDTIFLYYFIANQEFIDHATNISTGTRMPRANWKVLCESEWFFPPLSTQRKIAAILSAYDDLIENNLRRINILEEMAQALYREWFVHFRFPGHEKVRLVDSPLGKIPEGWHHKTLIEMAGITMGQSPKSIYYNLDRKGLPFHQGVRDFGSRFPSHKVYCTVQNRLAEPGDILFSVRAPVGRINIAKDRIIIGRGLAAIRSRFGQQNLLFYALKNHFFKEDMIGSGAIYAAITKKDLYEVELIQPSDLVAQTYMDCVQPIDSQIENLYRATEVLARTCDLLLPRLISGELDVSKLDIVVPEDI